MCEESREPRRVYVFDLSALTILSSVARSSDEILPKPKMPPDAAAMLSLCWMMSSAVMVPIGATPVSNRARINRVARAKVSETAYFHPAREQQISRAPLQRPRCLAREINIVRSAGVMPPSAHAISTIGTSGRMATVSGVKPRSCRSLISAGSLTPTLAMNSAFLRSRAVACRILSMSS